MSQAKVKNEQRYLLGKRKLTRVVLNVNLLEGA